MTLRKLHWQLNLRLWFENISISCTRTSFSLYLTPYHLYGVSLLHTRAWAHFFYICNPLHALQLIFDIFSFIFILQIPVFFFSFELNHFRSFSMLLCRLPCIFSHISFIWCCFYFFNLQFALLQFFSQKMISKLLFSIPTNFALVNYLLLFLSIHPFLNLLASYELRYRVITLHAFYASSRGFE